MKFFILALILSFNLYCHCELVTELLAIDKDGSAMQPGPPGGGGTPSVSSTILDWVKVTYPDNVTSCDDVTFANASGHPVSLFAYDFSILAIISFVTSFIFIVKHF